MSAEPHVHIEYGGIGRLAGILRDRAPAHRYAVISDSNVARLHGNRIQGLLQAGGLESGFFEFPAGEASKTRRTWATLTDALIENGYGRDSCVISLGGGVAGDLAGFVAATFMRGVPFVQVPTSLLAMVDASIGGKTGVDVPGGKNLVGAFLQPLAVVTDPALLETLPEPEFRAGLAEAVKHGMVASEAYLAALEAGADAFARRDPVALVDLVRQSVSIKAGIVRDDAREVGRRAILNFGHTVAHAIENVTAYALPHGFAVAIGMVIESAIGESIGITSAGTTDRLLAVLASLGLPSATPSKIRPDSILAATRTDKKARASRVRYALVTRPGLCRPDPAGAWTVEVPDPVVLQAIESRSTPVSQANTDV